MNSLPAVKSIHYYNFSVLFYEINDLNEIISIKDDAYLFFGDIDISISSLSSLTFLCFLLYFTVYTFISIFYRKCFKNNLTAFFFLNLDIDKDGSGTIDFSDFLEMMTSKMSERDSREEILKAFRLFDDDETGKRKIYLFSYKFFICRKKNIFKLLFEIEN